MKDEDLQILKAAAMALNGWHWPDRKRDPDTGAHYFGQWKEGEFYELGTIDGAQYTDDYADDIRLLKFLRLAQPSVILKLIERVESVAAAQAPSVPVAPDTIRDLDRIGMQLTADLCNLPVVGASRERNIDYLARQDVMDLVVSWRAAWDKNSASRPPIDRAALSVKAGATLQPSLLREPISASNPLPPGCYCKPGACSAPVIMGRQTPCRDPAKRDAAPTPPTTGEAR